MKTQKTPYFDLFKLYNILSLTSCEKQGETKVIFDQTIGRKVLSITGDVSLKNYLKFPSKSPIKEIPPLKYLYFLCNFPLGGLSSFYIDIKAKTKVFSLCFSTLNKSIKKLIKPNNEAANDSKGLQIPLIIKNNHWTVLIIDINSYLNEWDGLEANWTLSSIKLCANINIKTILASDLLFPFETFPQELRFRISKEENYLNKYNYTLLSNDFQKENILLPYNPTIIPTNLTSKPSNPLKTQENPIIVPEKPVKKPKKQVSFNLGPLEEPFEITKNPPLPLPHPTEELTNIPHFQLNPTPIMTLKHIHGYSGLSNTMKPYINNQIIYLLGSNLIIYDLNTMKQAYILDKSPILAFTQCFSFILLAYNNEFSIYEGPNHPIILLKAPYLTYKLIKSLKVFYLTPTKARLFLTGTDLKGRTLIELYELIKNPKEQGFSLIFLHKQLSDWDILYIEPITDEDFITCSNRGLRLFKLKTLPVPVFTSQNLDIPLIKDITVTITDMKLINDPLQVILSTNTGVLIIFNPKTLSVQASYKLGTSGINSLAIREGDSLIATGFDDGRVVLWRQDLSCSILEGKLESQAKSLYFLPDKRLLIGGLNGSIGIITPNDQKYRTFIRSHQEGVLDLVYNRRVSKVVTISRDRTIRVWGIGMRSDSVYLEGSYEFRCLDEEICKVISLNEASWVVCGFNNGLIRVFDLDQYGIVWEKGFEG